MSIRAQQIAELEEQLALHRQAEEAHEAWLKDKSTPIEYIPPSGGGWQPCVPLWNSNGHYRIAPKPKLRPWKPEEAIGKVVRQKDGDGTLAIICTAQATRVVTVGYYRSYQELLSDFEQHDGSPCGVVEP